MHVVSGRHVGAAFAVGVSKERFEVVPSALGDRTFVPVADVEAEDTGLGEDLEHDAELVSTLNGFTACCGDMFALSAAGPEAFHSFGGFPRGFEGGEILVEVRTSHGSVHVLEVLDDGTWCDASKSGGVVLEGGDKLSGDSIEDLFLEDGFDAVVGFPVADIAFPVALGLSAACVAVWKADVVWAGCRALGSSPYVAVVGRLSESIVGCFADDEGRMAKFGGRERRFDGGRIGKTFLFEQANGRECGRAGDRGERGVRHDCGEIRCG